MNLVFSVWPGGMDRGGISPVMRKYGCGLGGVIILVYPVKSLRKCIQFSFYIFILKVQRTWLFCACSLPLYFVVYGQIWVVHTILPCCPEHSDCSICLTSLWVPLHLGTNHCKACFGSVLVPFSTSLWNVVSLRGIISQGARKERGTD